MAAAGELELARQALLGLGVLSLVMAAVFMIRQPDIKRLLAYSSVEHMGILAIGVGIGRLTMDVGEPEGDLVAVSPDPGSLAASAPTAASHVAYKVAATQHLSRAETFLTSFRMSSTAGTADAEFWTGAGELLSNTRLLLDSPAGADPVFKELLGELELVLVQIVQLSYERGNEIELQLLTDGIERKGLLPRLRTAIPAGPATGMVGGVL